MDRALGKESFNLSLGLNLERIKKAWSSQDPFASDREPVDSSVKGQGWRQVGIAYILDPAMLEAISTDSSLP